MRFPFFSSGKSDRPAKIPLPETLSVGFGVYFQPQGRPLPTPEGVQGWAREWLERYAESPLRDVASSWLDGDKFLRVQVLARRELPDPPWNLLRYMGGGEEAERRYHDASHVVMIGTPDTVNHIHPGFWAALAAARATALQLGGVVLNPLIPRLLSVDSMQERLPEGGRLYVTPHILVLTSVDERGLALFTSKGLGTFGLPELEVKDAPRNLDAVRHLVNGMAQKLLETAESAGAGQNAPALELGPEVRLTLAEINRARGGVEAETAENARGWTNIRVEYRPSRRGDSFVRLLPPQGYSGDQGTWLYEAISDLFGGQEQMSYVKTDDERMEIAHRRAVEELPSVRARFAAGLPLGAALYIKHGFPTPQGEREFMWVVVRTWNGDRLLGQLANEPQMGVKLRAGQNVELHEADVFDWMVGYSDGRREGGYTTEVLLKE